MATTQKYTIRPFPKPARTDLKDAFRIYLSAAVLLSLKLRNGDPCWLAMDELPRRTAIAWTATERVQDTVVQTSKLLQELYGFKLGDRISILTRNKTIPEVDIASLVSQSKDENGNSSLDGDRSHWEWFLEHPLSRAEYLAVGMQFEQVELKGRRQSFIITDLSPLPAPYSQDLLRFTDKSKVKLPKTGVLESSDRSENLQLPDPAELAIGGLNQQISLIYERIQDFNIDASQISMPPYFRSNCGILLYGPKGTGKSLILDAIAGCRWQKLFKINSSILDGGHEAGHAAVRDVFSNAIRQQKSLIVIDQLEHLAPRRKHSDHLSVPTLAPTLCESLDNLGQSHVLVLTATRHPNDVDESLRTPNRLGLEIEIPVPNVQARKEILKAIRGSSDQPIDTVLDRIGERTHGYVGVDLFALLQLACRKARSRNTQQIRRSTSNGFVESVSAAETLESFKLEIIEDDVTGALNEIRPTAMREVFLETPEVRWTDIGGQHEIKRRLRLAVERPLKMAERMRSLNISSRKGVLLYGPPGCSKTLLVKALATEAGLNFLAVKGAEILSMYVGESERALREIFRKARSASPSIIFFDEIDAIAAKRSESGQNGGVNMLTTLLNEMDGIEELRNVLVVAATNKPEVLDPALMRPGRLDNLFYVGPPDEQAREEILSIWTSKSSVAADLEIRTLARETAGYSGAEIISICETAAEAALDEEEESGVEQEVQQRHFVTALSTVKRQITNDVTVRYEQWSQGVLRAV